MSSVSRSPRQPSYRLHKPSGQAVVTIAKRDVYLGKHGTPESKKAYKRLMLEWLANDGHVLPSTNGGLLVSELCAAYKHFAKRYYVRDGLPTKTYDTVAQVMKFLGHSAYGATPACEFGPIALKALRHQMIGQGHGRRYVNDQVDIIKRAFKWATSDQLLPASVFEALRTVEGLRSGRTPAKEPTPVKPVDDAVVDATIPFLPPVVDDMVRLLRLLGCRPGELCDLRPRNVDRSGNVWVYRPEQHKSLHKGRSRAVFIGPKAQEILAPYLLRDADAFCFSPSESDQRRRREQHESRKTPMSCGNKPGSNRKRRPKCLPGEKYVHTAINRAIKRACDRADAVARRAQERVPPEERAASDVRFVPRWHTYQLRHNAATEFRRKYGLEAAQVLLGHARANVTEIYAERDYGKAAAIMAEVG